MHDRCDENSMTYIHHGTLLDFLRDSPSLFLKTKQHGHRLLFTISLSLSIGVFETSILPIVTLHGRCQKDVVYSVSYSAYIMLTHL